MTGFLLCQKYNILSEIIPKGQEATETGMCFISFDDILFNILDQWSDIGYQTTTNKSKVVASVVQYLLEMISHYKQYFRDVPIVFYHTDIESSPELFHTGMSNGNEYRLNYLTRMTTIKFRDFRNLYLNGLYDIIQTVVNSIMGIYFVKTTNIDASLVPLIFAREYPNKPITVITWDNVDTMLSYLSTNITVVYDARQNKSCINPTVVNGRSYVDTVTNALNPNHYGKFASNTVVAAVGNDKRSLYGIGKRPSGYDMVAQWLQQAFGNNPIPIEYSDFTVISNQIRGDAKQDFEESFCGSDLEFQYQTLRPEDKTSILYGLDRNPVEPEEVRKLFPNIQVDWERVYS